MMMMMMQNPNHIQETQPDWIVDKKKQKNKIINDAKWLSVRKYKIQHKAMRDEAKYSQRCLGNESEKINGCKSAAWQM